MREDWGFGILLVFHHTLSSIWQPVGQGKVDGFVQVDLSAVRDANQ